MAILEKLTELGFVNAEDLGTAKGVTTVRIRTSNGWIYQRFASDEQVDAWSRFHKPEIGA